MEKIVMERKRIAVKKIKEDIPLPYLFNIFWLIETSDYQEIKDALLD
jgi:hypothetical protein